MKLLIGGLLICLGGIALLFAMVVRWVEPSFWLSFIAYGLALGGAFAAAMGAAMRVLARGHHTPHNDHEPPPPC